MIRTILFTALLLQAPAYEGEWIINVIDNIPVMPDTHVTLTVRNGGISGSASCNTYNGRLTVVAADRVQIGEILRTMKACDAPSMSQEDDFLSLLKTVVRLEVRPDKTLVLTTSAGKTITATRAGAASHRL
jgi:heat shock protein HslJ